MNEEQTENTDEKPKEILRKTGLEL